jgi:organic hydroperoxide reductase OsmC/OhrA
MKPYPHTYAVTAMGAGTGSVAVSSPPLPSLETAAPPEFDGPGGVWSPETLLCASIADCFVLTFRAIARAARFEWTRLECRVEGILERVERTSQFTRYMTFVDLVVPEGADAIKARELLERAEHGCLIANSLRGERALEARVVESNTESGTRYQYLERQ